MHRNVHIPASQKHVGKEVATEITQNFTEMVVYTMLIKRRNPFVDIYSHCADTRWGRGKIKPGGE
jgi:hypothetical protein